MGTHLGQLASMDRYVPAPHSAITQGWVGQPEDLFRVYAVVEVRYLPWPFCVGILVSLKRPIVLVLKPDMAHV